MRKMMIMVAALGIGWATQGCKKENPISPGNELNAQAPKVENGCLVFETNEQFSYYLEKTSNMTYDERMEWENSIGFRSLSTIENQANDIEVERMDTFFAGQPDNLNGNDYVAMGLIYEPSEFYKEYVAKGVLVTSFDENGNRSTDISVKNRSFIHLLNERGEVIVEGIRIKNEGNMTYLIDAEKNSIIHEYEVFKSGDEKLAKQHWLTKGIGLNTGQRDDWRTSGSNRRIRSWVYCYTGPFGNHTGSVIIDGNTTQSTFYSRMNVNHYYHAKAESFQWGSWNKRNSYKPITNVDLRYDYEYMLVAGDLHIRRHKSQPPWFSPVTSENALGSQISSMLWQQTYSSENEVHTTLRHNGMPWFPNTSANFAAGIWLRGFITGFRLYNPADENEHGGFYRTTFSGSDQPGQLTFQL